jgi:peptidoglycan-associated lipoprotein
MLIETFTCVFLLANSNACKPQASVEAEKIYASALSNYQNALEVSDTTNSKKRKQIRRLKSAYADLNIILRDYSNTEISERIKSSKPGTVSLLKLEKRIRTLDPSFKPSRATIVKPIDSITKNKNIEPNHTKTQKPNVISSIKKYAISVKNNIATKIPSTNIQNNAKFIKKLPEFDIENNSKFKKTKNTFTTNLIYKKTIFSSKSCELNQANLYSKNASNWELSSTHQINLIETIDPTKTKVKNNVQLFETANQTQNISLLDRHDFKRTYFDVDSHIIRKSDHEKLNKQITNLNADPSLMVVIEGHADERGTRDYNIALGLKRAQSVRDYLVSNGVDYNRIKLISYGKERPAVKGTGEAVWKQNRRAVTVDFTMHTNSDFSSMNTKPKNAIFLPQVSKENNKKLKDLKDERRDYEIEKTEIIGEKYIASMVAAAGKAKSNDQNINDALKSEAEKLISKTIENKINSAIPRTEISLNTGENQKPNFSITTVQPLLETDGNKNTLFVQGSVSSSDGSERTTANMGIGYRRLSKNEKWLFGVNAFLDYEFPYDHKRTSTGIELKSAPIQFTANKYKALTGWRSGVNGINEHALDGHDFEIGAQIPYLPTSRAYFRQYNWKGLAGASNLSGNEYSLEFSGLIDDGLSLEAKHDSPDQGVSSNSLTLTYKIKLGGYHDDQKTLPLVSKKAFEFRSMRDKTLEKVRRENNIIKVQSGLTLSFR